MKKFLSIALLGGALMLSGCGDDRDDFVWIDGGPTLAAPVAVADAYTVNANTTLTVAVANSVLLNDTVNGATLAFSATTTNGGTITGLADGSFTYTPALDFFGTDAFTYTLANSGGSSTTTVTITVAPVNAFIVDAATGSDTTGSFTNGRPFATVQAAVTAAGTGADIVVRPGSYTGAVNLKDGQRLLGASSSLITAQSVSAVKPVLTGPVVLADGNTLDSLRIANSPADCVDADGQNNGTVTNCELDTAAGTQQGFSGDGIRGTWRVSNNTIRNATAAGITVRTTATDNLIMRIENNEVSNNGAGGIVIASGDNSVVKMRVANNNITSNTLEGFDLICADSSTFGLDLESNTSDGVYSLFEDNLASVLSVEQLNELTMPRPGGAGNTGTVDLNPGPFTNPPTPIPDGFLGF